MKKRIVIIGTVAAVVLIGIVLFAVFGVPALRLIPFKTQIKNGEYSDARRTYKELDFEDRTNANTWLREYLVDIEKKYYSGQLDYLTATNILEEMTVFEAAYDEAKEAGAALFLDKQSTDSLSKAKEYSNKGDWATAYQILTGINIKYRLYEDVMDLRQECANNYRTEVLAKMSECATQQQIAKVQEIRDSALRVLPDDLQIIESCQAHLDNYVMYIMESVASLAEEKDYSGALQLLEHAQGEYADKSFAVAQGEYGYAAVVNRCEALVSKNDFIGAIEYAQEQSMYYPKAGELVSLYGESLVQNTLNVANEYVESDQFENAIATIETAMAVYYHIDLDNALNQIRYTAVENQCAILAGQGDLLDAVKYAKEYAGDDIKCQLLVEKYAEPVVADTLTRAAEYAQRREFQKAIDLIEEVRAVYDNAELAETVRGYTEFLPISLADCMSTQGDELVYGNLVDVYGKIHKNAVGFQDGLYASASSAYNKYYLAGKYVSLTGSLSIDSTKARFMVEIYLDGELAYKSEEIDLTTGEVYINIDLSDVNSMSIHVEGIDKDYTLIFDVVLS